MSPRSRVRRAARAALAATTVGLIGVVGAPSSVAAPVLPTPPDVRIEPVAAVPTPIADADGASGVLPVDSAPPVISADVVTPPSAAAARPATSPAAQPATSPVATAGSAAPATGTPLTIPGVVLAAYETGAQLTDARYPSCHLSWTLLASIGRIESDHASGGRVDVHGTTLGSILGPRLDGSPGFAAIRDTDGGVLDGDTVWDRAVGPMQFLPSTWRTYAVDANGDGVASPHNVTDAATAAGFYLCAGGADLTDPTQLSAAVFRYNHSAAYVTTVVAWARAYATGVRPVESLPGPVPAASVEQGTPKPADTAAPPVVAPPVATAPIPLSAVPVPVPTAVVSVPIAVVPVPTAVPVPVPTVRPTAVPVPTRKPVVVPTPTPAPPTRPAPPVPTPAPATPAPATPVPTGSPAPTPTPAGPGPTPAPTASATPVPVATPVPDPTAIPAPTTAPTRAQPSPSPQPEAAPASR